MNGNTLLSETKLRAIVMNAKKLQKVTVPNQTPSFFEPLTLLCVTNKSESDYSV